MKLLLDTHVLLWWLADSPVLSSKIRSAIARSSPTYISAATAWEIAIKKALGKLKAPDDFEEAITASRFQSLPITVTHALAAGRLPRHHDDPFDRMLIAQAQIETLTLVTRDARLQKYAIRLLLA